MTDRSDVLRRYQRRVRAFSRIRRGIGNAMLAYRSGAVIAATVAFLLVYTGLPLQAPLVDAALFALAGSVLLAVAGHYGWRRLRVENDLSEAFRMEALVGGLNSRLISAIDFLERESKGPLISTVIAMAGRDFDTIPFEARLARTGRARARRRFLAVLALMLFVGATPWCGYGKLAARASMAWQEVRERLFPTEWELLPGAGQHIHLLGESVEVQLRFIRNGFDRVVVIQDQPGNPDARETRETRAVAADESVRVVLRGDRQCVRRVRFEFGRRATRTEPVEIVFTTRPVIENMQIELVPPLYTRQPPRELVGVQTRVAGLPGTRVSLGLTFSKNITRATIRFGVGEPDIPLDVVGRFAAIQFVINENRRARIQIVDIHGFSLPQPHTLDIDLLVDEPPRLAVPDFLKAEMPVKADAMRAFGFGVRAWDDFGVAQTVLKWRKATLENRNAIIAQGEVERLNVPPLGVVVAEFLNAFSEQEVQPGDVFTFHVEVADNREPDAQRVVSPTFGFFVYQDDLGGALSVAEGGLMGLSFGQQGRERLKRHKDSTEVPPPQDIRRVSKLVSDFEADVTSDARPQTVLGDFGPSVDSYFKIMGTAVLAEEAPEKSPK